MNETLSAESANAIIAANVPKDDIENISDGFHTFKELYRFRLLYNAALFNELAKLADYKVYKSTHHHAGDICFGGGWFIVMATLPSGQISNHYEMKYWDLFKCREVDRADEWDGHTANDVCDRIEAILK